MFKRINVTTPFLFHGFITACVFLTACTGVDSVTKADLANEKSTPAPENRVISVLDLQAVKGIEAIAPKLANYRAVLVGESHTSYGDHLNQLAIINSLNKQWKGMAIGVEFVQQPFQQALDEYVACRLSEFDMLQKTQWYKRWKYDFRLYRPIFEFAREKKIPLIALNIPTELTKRISKVGLSGLTADERKQLPTTIDKSNSTYASHLKSIFNLHAHAGHTKQSTKKAKKPDSGFERFYEAQLAWDEGMAATAAAYLLKHPTQKMVVLAGGGHMISRHGIPARLERRLLSKVAVVLNDAGEQPTAAKGDFLLLSPTATLPKAGLLGIVMRQEKKGVIISGLMPNGAAKKAGLKKGDVVVSIADSEVKEMSDVKLLLLDAEPDEKREVSVLRGNKKLQKTLILQ